jgi:nicotinamide riboside transporter PnuC
VDYGQILSWAVGAVGLIGFFFAGKRKWWSWYINLFCQAMWFAYAFVTGQPAFLVTAAVYSVIFGINAYKWTREHRNVKRLLSKEEMDDRLAYVSKD